MGLRKCFGGFLFFGDPFAKVLRNEGVERSTIRGGYGLEIGCSI